MVELVGVVVLKRMHLRLRALHLVRKEHSSDERTDQHNTRKADTPRDEPRETGTVSLKHKPRRKERNDREEIVDQHTARQAPEARDGKHGEKEEGTWRNVRI